MSFASRWGALVVASLPLASSACSSAPAPVAPPPPADSSPPAVASAPKPPPAPRLTDFVDLFASNPDPEHDSSSGRSSVATTRFGRGVFTHRTFHVWGHRGNPCPVTRDEGCGSFAIHLDAAAAPPGDLWPSADPVDSPLPIRQDDKEAKVFPSPHAWVAFAGGRDAVYALREGGKTIDRIDDQGKVTLFAEDDAMTGWDELFVVERQGHTFVAGMGVPQRRGRGMPADDDTPSSSWRLAEALPAAAGAPRRLGPSTELPMRPMSARLNAQGARTASQDGKMASLRMPQLMALPDDGADKDRWAMVWLEIIPPPYNWPHDKPQKGVTAAPSAPGSAPKKGARHGCGGPASRSLDDASVTKRAHVTRFAGARMLDDQIRWTGASVGQVTAVQLAPRVEGAEVVVAMPAKARPPREIPGPRWPGDDDEGVMLRHDEQVILFTYDPVGREGLVTVRDHERQFYRRFDASGKPVGEAIELDKEQRNLTDVALIGGKWMALSNWPRALYNLSDKTGPFELPEARHRMAKLASVAGGGVLLEVEGLALKSTPVGPGGLLGPAVTVESLPTSFYLDRLHLFTTDQTTAVAFFERRDTPEGSDKIAWRPLAPGATWSHTELPSRASVSPYQLSYRELNGDMAVTIERHDREGFTWLKANQSAFYEPPSEPKTPPKHDDEPITSGPLLGHGLRLPTEPGPPVHDDVLVGLGKSCDRSVMTAPNTMVALCVHSTDPVVPSLRVALRTLHVEATR